MNTNMVKKFFRMYVDKLIAKVPISTKIGVHVQGSPSEMWTLPPTGGFFQYLISSEGNSFGPDRYENSPVGGELLVPSLAMTQLSLEGR